MPYVPIGGALSGAADSIALGDLAQIYPSGDGKLLGMGEGHLFALREWANR